ncbi:FadR/GntR family transcriptional regulator [Oceaniglobus trochenteri]|uniref:FadR/GntR family transcriptional regulator n=1 Tax=Oceaniglobus trochenteri TaxID=2763260 RepID=UPI003159ECB7
MFAVLREEIRSGKHPVGARLPTERELIQRFDVSRVCVREALAALRSMGLVSSRQGSGVYVSDAQAEGNGVLLTATTHAEILDCLELRLAIEVEAVGLAAMRRSPSQLDAMTDCLVEMRRCIEAGSPSDEADWAFHRAVAAAGGNKYFTRLMDGLGARAIPRNSLPGQKRDATWETAQHAEHMAILQAVSAQDRDAARATMRTHLTNAMARYREMRVAALMKKV